ncbi:MAG: hypothetical protein HY423_08370 [Candidatus Lambdaproteobacteria bacterium]|nr:hypothetical protein [Candidatus Lambdaproteobacteria bacterium]
MEQYDPKEPWLLHLRLAPDEDPVWVDRLRDVVGEHLAQIRAKLPPDSPAAEAIDNGETIRTVADRLMAEGYREEALQLVDGALGLMGWAMVL